MDRFKSIIDFCLWNLTLIENAVSIVMPFQKVMPVIIKQVWTFHLVYMIIEPVHEISNNVAF